MRPAGGLLLRALCRAAAKISFGPPRRRAAVETTSSCSSFWHYQAYCNRPDKGASPLSCESNCYIAQ